MVTANVTSGQAPFTVTFTNISKNADEFRWDFGDGSTTTTTDPLAAVTHEYTIAGTHTVILMAMKAGEPESSAAILTVIVQPGPLELVTQEPAEASLEVAEEQQFTVTAFDQFDNPIPGLTFSFASEDAAGKVDSDGTFIAGTTAGTYESAVTVEVTQGSVTRSATTDVTLAPGPLDHVALEPASPTVEVTSSQQFTAVALDQFDNPIPGLSFDFNADSQAGRVDGSGNFTAATKAGSYQRAVEVTVT